jgi:hypothetical protein
MRSLNSVDVCSLNEVSEVAVIAGSNEFQELVKGSLMIAQKAIQTKKGYFLVSASKIKSQNDRLAYVVHSMDMLGRIKPQLDKRRFPSLDRAFQVAESLAVESV